MSTSNMCGVKTTIAMASRQLPGVPQPCISFLVASEDSVHLQIIVWFVISSLEHKTLPYISCCDFPSASGYSIAYNLWFRVDSTRTILGSGVT